MASYRLPSLAKNKYLLVAGAFVVWMIFFDDRDVITTHFRQRKELHRLEDSRAFYLEEVGKTRAELNKLKSDPVLLEKYAREKYRMKKDNEELFIIAE